MLNNLKTLTLWVILCSSLVIFGQNETQYSFYRNNLISIKIVPPIYYNAGENNSIKLIIINLAVKYLYTDTNFVFGYGNNNLLLDNTPDASLETMLKLKRISPNDSLVLKISLDNTEIKKYISFPSFFLEVHFGYLFDIEKYLKNDSISYKQDNTFELSSGIALMLLKRKYFACGFIEFKK